MLKLGDALTCRIRAHNKNGWSNKWSMPNEASALSNCMFDAGEEPANPKCECKRSCRATGCGGCCNH
jgi:hypothetical protein